MFLKVKISLSAKVLFAIRKSNQSPSIKWIFLCRKLLSFIINHLCCQWLKKLKMSITYLICKTNDFCTFNEVILNDWFKVDEFPNMDQNTRLENNLLKKLLEAATKFYFFEINFNFYAIFTNFFFNFADIYICKQVAVIILNMVHFFSLLVSHVLGYVLFFNMNKSIALAGYVIFFGNAIIPS